jgi:hypothetical protein
MLLGVPVAIVVQLHHKGQRFTFTVDHRPPFDFWRV